MVKCINCANLESKTDDYPRLPRPWMDIANKHIKSIIDNECLYCKAKRKPVHTDFDLYKDRECSDFVAHAYEIA